MSHRLSRSNMGSADLGQSMFLAPTLALSMWNPFLSAARSGNSQANEGFGTIASECQDFANRRLKEDLALIQRLSCSCTPDQVLAAYADFWDTAAEDYGKQITTITKLMTALTTRMVAAAQPASDRAGASLLQARKAA